MTDTAALQAIRSPDPSRPLTGVERLRRLLALERHDVWSLAWYSGTVGLLSLAVPVAAQQLVNTVAFTALGQPVLALAVLVLVGLGMAALLRILRLKTIERLEQRLFVRATHDAVTRVTRARLSAFVEHGAPELMNRFFDIVTIQKASSVLLVEGLSVVLQGSVSLLLLAFYHPLLLAFDVLLFAAILFVVFGLSQGGMETAIKESKVKYNAAAWLEEVASSFRAFKASAADELAFRRADELAAGYVHERRKHFRVLLRQTIGSYVVQMFSTAGLLGLGGFLVIDGELTLGQLVAAELIVTSVTSGLTNIGKYLENFYDLVASVDKLGAIVDLEEEGRDGIDMAPLAGRGAMVRLEGVAFEHPGGSTVLRDVTFAIAPCEQLAILGGESSGKSTLADIIFALRFPTEGRITIDGLDTKDHSLRFLRGKVALVGHPEVFNGTVIDNVLMGLEPGNADVTSALAAAGLDDEVGALPRGLYTQLGHAGSRLTSSQASRLMIARALARRPKLLVLDQALDGLGIPTIDEILAGIRRYIPEVSLLVLTSREEIARRVGPMATLEDGTLRMQGEAAE